ncbi:hypothetical protein HRG_003498 [Hirsutella rhossiliensis]|uniref:F-box domain-containing protein n=1 Tax=Hirsutella rhossiliensis TaxID=111463 RepID=A0A9P8N2M1_9HYPO|nr:uncharacterized protein HRG_03498 [Hirsutella rhossiliensis]KAH0965482.1 hypothetical protein HRG_03498 [Hirsutella rhossiliensis]
MSPSPPSSPSSHSSASLPPQPHSPSPLTACAATTATPLEPHILQLPADILLLICDQLDTPEALSMSLTCKSVFALSLTMCQCRRKMPSEERRRFLLLLEADARMGRGVFYCHACNSLHPFQRDWGPRSEREASGAPARPHHCGIRDRFAPAGNPFGLSYHHARLVMNQHLYGPGRGLALGNICVRHTERRPATSILCTTDAQIKDGELLLLRTYAFTVADDSISEFRRGGGPRDFRLCEHTCFFPHSSSSPYRQHIPQLQPPRTGDQAFPPCHDAPGSCGLCLMDYVITVAPSSAAWDVTIKAYHQLGACRSPDDWKWARFSEAKRPHLFFPNRPNRRSSTLEAGAVRRRWLGEATTAMTAGKVGPDVDGMVASHKSVSLPITSWLWRDTKPLVCAEPS